VKNMEFVEKVLRMFSADYGVFFKTKEGGGEAEHEQELLHWSFKDDEITFWILCSDTFVWGCADCEALTPENFHVLEKAVDFIASVPDDTPGLRPLDAYMITILFASYMRKMKPMAPLLEGISPELLAEFERIDAEGKAGNDVKT